MIVFFAILSILVVVPPLYLLYIWLYPLPSLPEPDKPQTQDQRYDDIEAGLVSKPVLEHDSICDQARVAAATAATSAEAAAATAQKPRLSSFSLSGGRDEAVVDNNMDELFSSLPVVPNPNNSSRSLRSSISRTSLRGLNETECLICFEPFRVGNIVSWSSTKVSCDHVFHHACLKEWLLLHDSCPYCREIILPIRMIRSGTASTPPPEAPATVQEDEENPSSTTSNVSATIQHNCFYCQQHGLVRVNLFDEQTTSLPLLLRERITYMCSADDLAKEGRRRPPEEEEMEDVPHNHTMPNNTTEDGSSSVASQPYPPPPPSQEEPPMAVPVDDEETGHEGPPEVVEEEDQDAPNNHTTTTSSTTEDESSSVVSQESYTPPRSSQEHYPVVVIGNDAEEEAVPTVEPPEMEEDAPHNETTASNTTEDESLFVVSQESFPPTTMSSQEPPVVVFGCR